MSFCAENRDGMGFGLPITIALYDFFIELNLAFSEYLPVC